MARFFPRDVIDWSEERLHPLRAFALRTIEPAGITGVVLRLWRTVLLSSDSALLVVLGILAGAAFLCAMLTWHLGHYPLRRWPARALAFLLTEVTIELGMSSMLIVFRLERLGSTVAGFRDWWTLAAQTIWQRTLVVLLFTLLLALVVQFVRRVVDQRPVADRVPE
jgi:hypothetical protein